MGAQSALSMSLQVSRFCGVAVDPQRQSLYACFFNMTCFLTVDDMCLVHTLKDVKRTRSPLFTAVSLPSISTNIFHIFFKKIFHTHQRGWRNKCFVVVVTILKTSSLDFSGLGLESWCWNFILSFIRYVVLRKWLKFFVAQFLHVFWILKCVIFSSRWG